VEPKSTYSFILVLDGVNEDTPDLGDKLYGSGCNDALINFRGGVVFLDFDREACSLKKAILSAITDIENVGIGAKVTHIEGDYVTLTEISEKIDLSKQAISLFIKGQRGGGGFPVPFCRIDSASPIWKWADVACWLFEQGKISDAQIVKDAHVISELNMSLQVLGGISSANSSENLMYHAIIVKQLIASGNEKLLIVKELLEALEPDVKKVATQVFERASISAT
jgi:hypothetical protein